MGILFLDAHQFGAMKATASCIQDQCMELTCYWKDLNGGNFDKWRYTSKTAWTGRNTTPLTGTRKVHQTLNTTKEIRCTNTPQCAAQIALDPYEANNCTNCKNPSGVPRWFCATVGGLGVTGSWNEGLDDGG